MASATDTKTRDFGASRWGRRRWSPLARRILAVNVLALAILVGGVMVLGRYQERLIQTELSALRTEARIFAAALGEGAVVLARDEGREKAALFLEVDLARRMVRRLAEPTTTRTRLYDAQGDLVADSQEMAAAAAPARRERPALDQPPELPPASRWLLQDLEQLYAAVAGPPAADDDPSELDQAPPSLDARQVWELRRALAGNGGAHAWGGEGGLLLTAAMPVVHGQRVLGALQLTQSGARLEAAIQSVRVDILDCFVVALAVTVALSHYLAGTIVTPIRRLALAAERVRRGRGRHREIPDLTGRQDEIGELSLALREMTASLWARMDATERFAADVAHEIKNPLSSLRSAVETMVRLKDPERQRPLIAIIGDDVNRLDRLITDISNASRLDAELSRAEPAPVDLRAILRMLAEIHATTAGDQDGAPQLRADLPDAVDLTVPGVESRLVQVFQNLIANARSFSPAGGTITLGARRDGEMVEVTVSDQGPGIPEGKLAAIFDRFYSERPASEKFGIHSGLGLSISQQIIAAHRGTITAANRHDADGAVEGAVFTVRLPRA